MRALTRYWFIIPLLGIFVGLQLGLGLVAVKGAGFGFKIAQQEAEEKNPSAAPLPPGISSPPVVVSTSMPTDTPTPTITPSPTFTPSPTRTPTPTNTPTGTLPPTIPVPPSPTPTSTLTPTPGPTPLGQSFTLDVPILMYHYVSVPPAGADEIRVDLSVPPDQFEAHLAYLRQAGYETISMRQLVYALSRQTPLPPKPIIISFDDGYRDNYEHAFPLLRQYGYTGIFYVFTYPIDNNNPDYLTWDMVVEMHQAGMEFGSHSYTHANLWRRDVDFLVFEILAAKEAIEARTGEPVYFFAYPFGYYDDLTIRVLESAHFWNAVTTELGVAQSFANRFEMPRIRLHNYDDAEDLARKLRAF